MQKEAKKLIKFLIIIGIFSILILTIRYLLYAYYSDNSGGVEGNESNVTDVPVVNETPSVTNNQTPIITNQTANQTPTTTTGGGSGGGNGGSITSCSDTCSSLGFECGNFTICGSVVDCGICGSEEVCNNGVCSAAGGPFCGDTICTGLENCSSCPEDCGCEGGEECKGGVCELVNCTVDNNCFYVSAIGAGSHDGSLGNEMNLSDAQAYANAHTSEEITFLLEGGEYGVYTESKVSRSEWVVYKALPDANVVFDKIDLMSYDPDPEANYPVYLQFQGIKVESGEEDGVAVKLHTVSHVRLYNTEIVGDGYSYSAGNPESCNSKAVHVYKSHDVEINNTHIYGNGPSYAETWPGVYPKDPATSADATLHGQGWVYGVYAYPAGPNIKITNSLIEQCDSGLFLDGNNHTIKNNELRYLTTDAIAIAGKQYDENQKTIIENNHIHHIYSFYNEEGTDLGSHNDGIQFYGTTPEWTPYSNMIVRNNTVHNIEHQGLFFNTGNNSKNWIIENNLVYKVPENPEGWSVGVWKYSAKNITFRNNTVNGKTLFTNGNGHVEIKEITNNIINLLDLGTEKGIIVGYEDKNLLNKRWIDMQDHILGENSIVLDNETKFKNLFVSTEDHHPLINTDACNGTITPVGIAVGALPCVCTADWQCVEVFGSGSVCNLQTRGCEGGLGSQSVQESSFFSKIWGWFGSL